MHNDTVPSPIPDTVRWGRRAHTFVPTPEWILVAGLSPQAQALYTLLLAHVNRQRSDGVAWPGLDTLAQLMGYSRRQSVARYVRELADVDAVTVVVERTSTGRRNVYTVNEVAPTGYEKPVSLTEFYARRKTERKGWGATAHYGLSATAHNGWGAEADMNQMNATTRSDSYEDASSVDAPAGASPAACLPHRASSPGDRRIVLPKGFYTDAYSDKRARQYLVGAALKAIEAAGYDPADTAGQVIGSAIKHKFKDWPRRELVRIVRDAVRHAGDPHHIDGQLARGCEYIAREAS